MYILTSSLSNQLTPQCISFWFIRLAASCPLPMIVTNSASSEIELGCPGETDNEQSEKRKKNLFVRKKAIKVQRQIFTNRR